MLKNILKLNGAQQLSKDERKSINWGRQICGTGYSQCPIGYSCIGGGYGQTGICVIAQDVCEILGACE